MAPMKRRHPLRRFFLGVLILAALAGWFWWQQNGLVTETYTIPGAPAAFQGYRIAVLSDLHGKQFGEDNQRLINYVAGLDPDCIALTGDFIDREAQKADLPALVRGLSAIAPTYYVTGNHEWAVGGVPELKAMLADSGATVLSDEYVIETRDGATLAIAGVDDPNGYADQKTGDVLRQEIDADFVLLLAHRDTVEKYDGWGYDLILSGHGHGGMFRIPFLDKGLISSKHTLFPEYDGGCYPLSDGGYCLVSRGLGSNTVPFHMFRLFNRPDVPLAILE